ncbi:precorrin-6Y C5,15-methyltransferase (decarboxylating) subunit CbiT [Phosphitispora sp. TUW77]|uniref:precorrin-6Y C5,15-methyltransferase (decarboxylating) subunit CbiT n=1 Tax=Phosphitispora sp. TUW77 TaxID=3152361 RepID=UPI003AB2C5F5
MNEMRWSYKTGGIPDELFHRGKVPMTKAEVRAVTLAKARLNDRHLIWDIGAGTGSITVEAALVSAKGTVYAVEKEAEGIALIKENSELFGVDNIAVIQGTAPEALFSLPAPDRVFIGGSGGNFRAIMDLVFQKLVRGGRIVINAVVLETFIEAVEIMQEYGFTDVDITQVSIAKTVDLGRIHMFKSHNPVFVISGEKP